MTKFFGFLLGIAVACALPAAFGVLAADGGVELTTKEQALAYGIGALVFWGVVSLFSGAAALGAALAFGTMIYAVHWIPNRTTNFLNDVPGVTTGMIDGLKNAVLGGVVPILAVISLIYSIQLITGAVRRRRARRAEEARLVQEEALAAEREDEVTPQYPVADDYPTRLDNRYAGDPQYDAPYTQRYDEDVDAGASEPTRQFAAGDRTGEDEQPSPVADDEKADPDGKTAQFAAGEGADSLDDSAQYAGQYRERMDEPDTGWDLTVVPAEDPLGPTPHQAPDQPRGGTPNFRPATEHG